MLMYQLMIIDDEPVVRCGMKQLIPWEEHNFEICAEGIDGKDGLKKVLEYSPDLVLVDVKMPGMSGIELIRQAKKEGYDGKFIILTGYSDFEFAKSAVSLGVRAYLLKPIDEEELLQNIIEVKVELDAKKHLDDYYNLSELKARQEILRRLLVYSEDKEELRKDIRLYGMDYRYQSYCVAIICQKEGYLEENQTEIQEKQEVLLKDLDQIDRIILDNRLVLINKGRTYHQLYELLHKNYVRVKRRYGANFFIAIGHDVAHWEDIHFSYETAKLLLDYEFLYKDNSIISIDIFRDDSTYAVDNYDLQLGDLIEIGDLEGIESVLTNIKNYYKAKLMKESEVKVLVIHNMVLLQGMLEKKYRDRKASFPDFKQLVEEIRISDNLEDLMGKVTDYSTRVAEMIGISSDHVTRRMVAYMRKNYNQDLKLENIAKMFNYNSAYLGKIFKKEMGENFNNILDSIRIENAKRLLLETDLKVYQVSEEIGYHNIDYFYSKFKKYVGSSPKEFKKENY